MQKQVLTEKKRTAVKFIYAVSFNVNIMEKYYKIVYIPLNSNLKIIN